MKLSLSSESGQDIENFIGVSGNGTDGYDSVYEVPYEETSEIGFCIFTEKNGPTQTKGSSIKISKILFCLMIPYKFGK